MVGHQAYKEGGRLPREFVGRDEGHVEAAGPRLQDHTCRATRMLRDVMVRRKGRWRWCGVVWCGVVCWW